MGETNPFDSPLSVMKTLQGQVQDLQAALAAEQQQRIQEVSELRALLQHTIADQQELSRYTQSAIANQTQRLEAAQDRIRYQQGDQERKLDQEMIRRDSELDVIREQLASQVQRLSTTIEEFKVDEDAQIQALSNSLMVETQERQAAQGNLGGRLSAEAERLGGEISRLAQDLSEHKTSSDANFAHSRKTESDLSTDIRYIAKQIGGIATISEAYKAFSWRSMARPTAPATDGAEVH